MDSLSIVEYRNTIQDEFKVKVDADVLFNYPNILSLTKFIVSLLDQNQESKKTDDEENVENTKEDNDVCVSESDVVNILLDFYRSKNKKEVLLSLLENQVKKILHTEELDYECSLNEYSSWDEYSDDFVEWFDTCDIDTKLDIDEMSVADIFELIIENEEPLE